MLAIGICILCIGGVSAHPSHPGPGDVTSSWSFSLPQNPWLPSAYLTDTDDSTTVDISTGDWFIVQLPENPLTGNQWDMTASSGLDIFFSDYRQDDNPDNRVGVGGSHVWFISATGSGNQMITGVYKHPWESQTPDSTRYLVNINVT